MFCYKIPLISSMACLLCVGATAAEEKKEPPKTIEEGTSTTNVYDSKENVPDQTLPSRFYWDSYPYKQRPAGQQDTVPLDGNKHLFNEYDIPGEIPYPDYYVPDEFMNAPDPNNYYDRYWRREEDNPVYKISPSNFNPTFFERESDQDRWERERQEREQQERERDEQRRRDEDQRRLYELQQRHSHDD